MKQKRCTELHIPLLKHIKQMMMMK